MISVISGLIVVATAAILTTIQPRYSATSELTLIDQRQQSIPIADLLSGVPLSRQLVQQEITTMRSKAFMIDVAKRLETENGTLELAPPQPPILPVRMLRRAKRFVSGLLSPVTSEPRETAQPIVKSTEIVSDTDDASDDLVLTPSFAPDDAFLVLAADQEKYGETADQLSGMLNISQLGNGYVIRVTAQSVDPILAAQIANTVSSEYARFSLNIRGDSIEEQVQLLSARVDELGQNLEKAETDVVAFQEQVMGVNDSSAERLDQEIESLASRLVEARADVLRAQASYNKVFEILSLDGSIAAANVLSSPILSNVRAELSGHRIERSRAVERFGAESSQVSGIDAVISRIYEEIEVETARLLAEHETEVDIAKSIEASIATELERAENVVLSRSRNMVQLAKLKRIADANRIAYEEFLSIATESAQYRALQQPTIRPLSFAETPTVPSSPRTLMSLAMAGLSSLAAGLGLAILIEAMSDKFKTSRQLRDISRRPVIGSFSQVKSGTMERLRKFIAYGEGQHVPKKFETAIQEGHGVASFVQNALNGGKQTVVVSSAVTGEGASLVAMLYASALADRKQSVILLDACRRWDKTMAGQLTLNDESETDDKPGDLRIIKTSTNFHVLKFLNDETPALSYLSDKQITDILNTVSGVYDYIVIDAPPILSSAGALRFVKSADALLIASRWNSTPRQTVEACIEKLKDVAALNVLMVMTQVKRRVERKYEYTGYSKTVKSDEAHV
jgi:uncharacterized protein involved in exopolysaccharide biosynthesis